MVTLDICTWCMDELGRYVWLCVRCLRQDYGLEAG
uniref:Uncharacterized protein n=1 Tax=Nelumbo nucifera TaxID=4432 RepID=A0A822XRT1_NELNU|nr:TPA_asm: hypothetical protein HUJ06_021641 [Nelumbo nucifera]